MRSYEEAMAASKDEPAFSNGTEGYAWMANWCDECVNNDEETELWCPLLTVALLQRTPVEWVEQPWGQVKGAPEGETAPRLGDTYHCTEFRQRPEPGDEDDPEPEPEPPPVCDGQLDLIDAYLETALAELTPKSVEVS
jgi:hypothetical protein